MIPYRTKELLGNWTNSWHDYNLNFFFENGIFINGKKIEKIHMESGKSINSFEMKERIGFLIVY